MKHFSLPQALSLSLSHMDTCTHIHSNRPLLQTEIKGECALLIFMNGHLHLALAKATKANCFSKIVFYVKMPPKKGSHKIKCLLFWKENAGNQTPTSLYPSLTETPNI